VKRRELGLFLAIASCVFGGTVFAQAMPTDIELRTAYCIRVTGQQLQVMREMIGGEPQGSPAYGAVQKLLQDQATALNRLRSYLLPKLSSLQPDALIAAAGRADADMEQAKGAGTVCTKKCEHLQENGRPGEKWALCVEQCADNPLTKRLRACREPDWLPF